MSQGGGTSQSITPRRRGRSLFVWPHGARINSNFQFVYDSLRFVTDIKMKIMHAVETSYEFDTSQAPENIGRNASRAQALLSKMRFVYRVRLFSPQFMAN